MALQQAKNAITLPGRAFELLCRKARKQRIALPQRCSFSDKTRMGQAFVNSTGLVIREDFLQSSGSGHISKNPTVSIMTRRAYRGHTDLA